MQALPIDLYTSDHTREIEQRVIEQHGIPAGELMARAASASLATIQHRWPHAKHLLIICGIGNNGGDGYELARQAKEKNYQVTVVPVGDQSKSSSTAQVAHQKMLATGITPLDIEDQLPEADIIVDALFGIGLTRDISGEFERIINIINTAVNTPALALDCPSGLDVDTGCVRGVAIKASATISFLALNPGLFTGLGPDYCGEIYFDSLSIPSDAYNHTVPDCQRVTLQSYSDLLAPRKRSVHKGHYGHTLVIGGDEGMSGAVRMAAEGAARVGSGLVSVATRKSHSAFVNLNRPELMCHSSEQADQLGPLLQVATNIVIGPGLGQHAWGRALFQKALESELPLIIDADALNLLSETPCHRDNWILTPHPGEAARLLGCTSADIQSDRLAAITQLEAKYGGTIVLKGAGTLICNGQKPSYLSTYGNPGMSSGGMGDVLAGVIGGLVAQGISLTDAACLGVVLHSYAADKAAEQGGERGLLASDLMPYIRQFANLIL